MDAHRRTDTQTHTDGVARKDERCASQRRTHTHTHTHHTALRVVLRACATLCDTHTHTHTRTHTVIYTQTHTHTHTPGCANGYMFVWVYMTVYVRVCVPVCACIFVRVYVRVYVSNRMYKCMYASVSVCTFAYSSSRSNVWPSDTIRSFVPHDASEKYYKANLRRAGLDCSADSWDGRQWECSFSSKYVFNFCFCQTWLLFWPSREMVDSGNVRFCPSMSLILFLSNMTSFLAESWDGGHWTGLIPAGFQWTGSTPAGSQAAFRADYSETRHSR